MKTIRRDHALRIEPVRRRLLFRRCLVFNLVGGLGILVQLAVLIGVTEHLNWDYGVGTAAAVEAAVLHNFIWHVRWTWAERCTGGTAAILARLARFHVTNGIFSLLGNLLLMKLFVGILSLNYILSNLLSISICSIFNFLAGDRIVFVGEPAKQTNQG